MDNTAKDISLQKFWEKSLLTPLTIENFIVSLFHEKDFYSFWKALSSGLNNSKLSSHLATSILTSTFNIENQNKDKFHNLYKQGLIVAFLDNFYDFYKNQTTFTQIDLGQILKDDNKDSLGDHLFIYSAINQREDLCEFTNAFRKNKNIDYMSSQLNTMISRENFKTVDLMLKFSENNQNVSGTILNSFYKNNVSYTTIKNYIEKENLDINNMTLALVQDWSHFYNFSQQVITSKRGDPDNIALTFIKDFGAKIDFDKVMKFKSIHSSYTTEFTILDKMIDNSKMSQSEKLERLQYLIEYANLKEKNILNLVNVTVKPEFINNQYQHPYYKTLFKSHTFNSNTVNKDAVLNTILNLDISKTNKATRKNSQETINPVAFVLNDFLESVHITSVEPFLNWVNLHKSKDIASKEVFNLLFLHLKDSIKSLDINVLQDINNNSIVEYLLENQVHIPKKSWGFKKWFGSDDKTQEVIIQLAPVLPAPVETQAFNTLLFEKVTDHDLQKYIQAIQLNYEQYTFLCTNNNDSHHYMNNLLPKFLNKTIENYLYFSTIDEPEAHKNVLVQLQLLNKKTFEVLNENLENTKELLSKDTRVQTNIMKQY